MPRSITFHLKGDTDKKHGYYMASLMHGFLMERMDDAYAGTLHKTGIHPYSQSVREKGEDVIWTVNCLNTESEQYICNMLLDDPLEEITLSHRDETLKVVSREDKGITYQELVEQYYFGNHDRYIRLNFITPTSFKQNGEYCLFPSVRLIFQSLMKKFDACSEDNTVYSDEILEHYEKYARITGYNLRSTMFHLEGVKIPSFLGGVTIKINGPDQMVNMARMLAEFGTYSGVGIKCGIGMGAMRIEDEKDNFRRKKKVI